jgi:hypothetical protein
MISDFSSRRVASELVAFGEATEIGRPDRRASAVERGHHAGPNDAAGCRLVDQDEMLRRGLGSSFEVPSIYITGPNGIEATSNDRIIQRGDLLMIDYGVGYLNMWTDQKRIAYVLKPGRDGAARELSARVRQRRARPRRDPSYRAAREDAQAMMDEVNAAVVAAGFTAMRGFNEVRADASVEFIIGCHSVGDWGHGIGPSMAFFNPGGSRTRCAHEPLLDRAVRVHADPGVAGEEAADSAGG